jgi:hypothetical protein
MPHFFEGMALAGHDGLATLWRNAMKQRLHWGFLPQWGCILAPTMTVTISRADVNRAEGVWRHGYGPDLLVAEDFCIDNNDPTDSGQRRN